MGSRQGRRAGLIAAAIVIGAVAMHDVAVPPQRALGVRAGGSRCPVCRLLGKASLMDVTCNLPALAGESDACEGV